MMEREEEGGGACLLRLYLLLENLYLFTYFFLEQKYLSPTFIYLF